MMEMMLGQVTPVDYGIAGQIQYLTPGTYTWVCPPDVFSVCCVLIGGGAHGSARSPSIQITGGFGGGLRYRNNIPVIPGTSYTVVIAPISAEVQVQKPSGVPVETSTLMSTAFGLSAGVGTNGSGFTADILGGYGCTNTYFSSVDAGQSGGGSTGTYTNGTGQPAPTLNGGFTVTYGPGSDLYGNGNTYASAIGTGGPARGAGPGAGDKTVGFTGRCGAVRIIWGENRSFPNSNVHDV